MPGRRSAYPRLRPQAADHGSYRRIALAFFSAGLAAFAVLYCVQALLPDFARVFRVSPAVASLVLSCTTLALAAGLPAAGLLSDLYGRRPFLIASLLAADLLDLASALAPAFAWLLVARTLLGLAMAGMTAVAVAYLAEEVDPAMLGFAMGTYVAGNSVGGLLGRVFVSWLAPALGWRGALTALGVLALGATVVFWRLLPPSRHFRPRPVAWAEVGQVVRRLAMHPALGRLFLLGAAIMGSFVAVYNYLGFRLTAPPYRWSTASVGWIFLVYLVGTATTSWMGRLADRHGRARLLLWSLALMAAGALVTLAGAVAVIVAGVALLTVGFFSAHADASAWVGQAARQSKGLASSLYLVMFYLGSSVSGTIGGLAWTRWGWPGVVGLVLALLASAAGLGSGLRRVAAAEAAHLPRSG